MLYQTAAKPDIRPAEAGGVGWIPQGLIYGLSPGLYSTVPNTLALGTCAHNPPDQLCTAREREDPSGGLIVGALGNSDKTSQLKTRAVQENSNREWTRYSLIHNYSLCFTF